MKITKLFEELMMAVTFAEAGEFKTAIEIITKKRDSKRDKKDVRW